MKPDQPIPVQAFQRQHPLISDPGESQFLPHLPQLDGVRAIAVLLVIWQHFVPASAAVPGGPSWGAIGVGLFFTLSGFLITRILLNGRVKIEAGSTSLGRMLKQFYVRRFLRIFPLYYGVLGVLTLFNVDHIRERIWWHLAYLTNIRFAYYPRGAEIERHLWSLSVEEQFYIFWPLMILLAPRKLLLPVMILAVAAAPVFRYYTYAPGFMVHEWMMFSCLDLLGMGAILAILSAPQFGLSRWWNGFVETIGLIGIPLFFVYITLHSIVTPLHKHPRTGRQLYENEAFEWQGGATYVVTALAATWLIGAAARGFKGPFGWLLRCAPMVYIGRISYGLYVLHIFVPYLFLEYWPTAFATLKSNWLGFAVFTSVSILMATVSWYAFEAPINRLKRYFEYEEGKSEARNPKLKSSPKTE